MRPNKPRRRRVLITPACGLAAIASNLKALKLISCAWRLGAVAAAVAHLGRCAGGDAGFGECEMCRTCVEDVFVYVLFNRKIGLNLQWLPDILSLSLPGLGCMAVWERRNWSISSPREVDDRMSIGCCDLCSIDIACRRLVCQILGDVKKIKKV